MAAVPAKAILVKNSFRFMIDQIRTFILKKDFHREVLFKIMKLYPKANGFRELFKDLQLPARQLSHYKAGGDDLQFTIYRSSHRNLKPETMNFKLHPAPR